MGRESVRGQPIIAEEVKRQVDGRGARQQAAPITPPLRGSRRSRADRRRLMRWGGASPQARRWGGVINPSPPTIPMPSARPFSCAPKKKAEKEGRRSDAAGAAFPRIVPVVETEASALRALRDSRGASDGRNRAEKPHLLRTKPGGRQPAGILKQLPCALRRTH